MTDITTKKLVGELTLSEKVLTDIDLDKLPNTDITSSLDYTAFEVFPTDKDIEIGDVDDVTKLAYKVRVPASMVCGLILDSNFPQSECNIVIDWGDGEVYDIKNMPTESSSLNKNTVVDSLYVSAPDSKGEYEYQIVHVYKEPGRYIVKIYGNTYYGIKTTHLLGWSLVSRVLSYDLPIASCVASIASMCTGAYRLQKLDIPRYSNLNHIRNITSAFSESLNLLKVTGLNYMSNFSEGLLTANGMFASCLNLESSNFTVPKSAMLSNGLAAIYSACGKLSCDVLSLLPVNGFSDRYIDV